MCYFKFWCFFWYQLKEQTNFFNLLYILPGNWQTAPRMATFTSDIVPSRFNQFFFLATSDYVLQLTAKTELTSLWTFTSTSQSVKWHTWYTIGQSCFFRFMTKNFLRSTTSHKRCLYSRLTLFQATPTVSCKQWCSTAKQQQKQKKKKKTFKNSSLPEQAYLLLTTVCRFPI